MSECNLKNKIKPCDFALGDSVQIHHVVGQTGK